MSKRSKPECRCFKVSGAEDVQVYVGARGHVVIKQDDNIERTVSRIFVIPEVVPRLIMMLRLAAVAAAEAVDECPAHPDDQEGSS